MRRRCGKLPNARVGRLAILAYLIVITLVNPYHIPTRLLLQSEQLDGEHYSGYSDGR